MKGIFTLLVLFLAQVAISQTTYYWVGGAAPTSTSFNNSAHWNTTPGGGGAARTTPLPTDILIFDGLDISDVAGTQTGPIIFGFSAPPANTGPSQLKFLNGVDVTFRRSGTGGTTTLTVGVGNTLDTDPDFVVDATSKFRIAGLTGSIVVAIETVATGEVAGEIYMMENINDATAQLQNRITAKGARALHFLSGSTFYTLPAYNYYPFGSGGSVLPGPYGVVFEQGSTFDFGGGWSPWGSNSVNQPVEFLPGSKFIFRTAPKLAYNPTTPPTTTSMFTNRSYPDVVITNNTTVTADGNLIRIDSLRIEAGSTFITHISGTTPINGNVVVNGTLRVPAANPDRDNRLLLSAAIPQSVSGTGTITLADFIISNVSNSTLQRSIQVDTITTVIGTLNPAGNSITGPGTISIKAPSSFNITGNIKVDSFFVTGVSDFTGIEVGMSVSGTGIPANTVVTNTSSTNGTITLSKAATTTATAQALVVFNGQGIILPVKFGAFTAYAERNTVRLQWQVHTEENVDQYVVERSVNGIEFNSIGSVNANKLSNYYYSDLNPLNGTGYYRIKAVDFDGKFLYSAIAKVNIDNGKAELSAYPNPVTDRSVNISVSGLIADQYTLLIVNSVGQTVMSQNLGKIEGSLSKQLQLPIGLQADTYYLIVRGSSFQLQRQLIIK